MAENGPLSCAGDAVLDVHRRELHEKLRPMHLIPSLMPFLPKSKITELEILLRTRRLVQSMLPLTISQVAVDLNFENLVFKHAQVHIVYCRLLNSQA